MHEKIIDLTKSENNELMEKRASIYWWFSTLLISELSPEQIDALISDEGTTFLDTLSSHGLAIEIDTVKKALHQLNKSESLTLELAADYTQTFLRDNKHSALPYASVYMSDDNLLYQEAHQKMVDLLQQQGLAVSDSVNEPADHIAIQLDYMGNLVIQALNSCDDRSYQNSLQNQRAFLENHLLNWLPAFNHKCSSLNDAVFYPTICKLLLRFVHLDQNFLQNESGRTLEFEIQP